MNKVRFTWEQSREAEGLELNLKKMTQPSDSFKENTINLLGDGKKGGNSVAHRLRGRNGKMGQMSRLPRPPTRSSSL